MNVYKAWEFQIRAWKDSNQTRPAPRKPYGYDTWKQGADPLIQKVDTINCRGGELVGASWTQKAFGAKR